MMNKNSEAKERFLSTVYEHSTRAIENSNKLIDLAKKIVEAEDVGFVIDPDSVENAVKRIMGVD